jgi:pimeloyl-ACP methyl ester carboxylesterase
MQEKFIQIPAYFNWYKLQYVPSHILSYIEHGDVSNKNIIICAHGLTRNGHDFDKIASSLSDNFRVIAINYPGRYLSQYFENKKYYNYGVYIKDSLIFLKLLNLKKVTWLGTSMGGLIGMVLASKYPKIISSLILNDIGPHIPAAPIAKISNYASKISIFNNLDECKKHLKLIYSQFGINDEEDWNHLVKYSFIKNENDKYIMAYDKNIIESKKKQQSVNLWHIWNKINCKLLLIHGMKSNILLKDTVESMLNNKNIDLYEVSYAGHSPSLMDFDQINYIKNWLLKNEIFKS